MLLEQEEERGKEEVDCGEEAANQRRITIDQSHPLPESNADKTRWSPLSDPAPRPPPESNGHRGPSVGAI